MENDKIKTSRASQTRDKIEVKKVWTPPNSLDAPPAPTGYRHQWIRAEVLGFNDAKNVSSHDIPMRDCLTAELNILTGPLSSALGDDCFSPLITGFKTNSIVTLSQPGHQKITHGHFQINSKPLLP